jgi:hypothetical protein
VGKRCEPAAAAVAFAAAAFLLLIARHHAPARGLAGRYNAASCCSATPMKRRISSSCCWDRRLRRRMTRHAAACVPCCICWCHRWTWLQRHMPERATQEDCDAPGCSQQRRRQQRAACAVLRCAVIGASTPAASSASNVYRRLVSAMPSQANCKVLQLRSRAHRSSATRPGHRELRLRRNKSAATLFLLHICCLRDACRTTLLLVAAAAGLAQHRSAGTVEVRETL